MNTLVLQAVRGEPGWAAMLTPTDRRGLTPLFWEHVRPYGASPSASDCEHRRRSADSVTGFGLPTASSAPDAAGNLGIYGRYT